LTVAPQPPACQAPSRAASAKTPRFTMVELEKLPMKKFACTLGLIGFVLVAMLALGVDSARAIPPFKKEFDAKYVKKESNDPNEKALAQAVERVKCNVCHKGKDKKMRNSYGEELAKLLDKQTDAKDPQKIQEALEKVAQMRSDANNDNSPTYGDLLKQGKLPGGDEE
jgi:hypothetical protein